MQVQQPVCTDILGLGTCRFSRERERGCVIVCVLEVGMKREKIKLSDIKRYISYDKAHVAREIDR